MSVSVAQMRNIIEQIQYKSHVIMLKKDDDEDRYYVQVGFERPDIRNGEMGMGWSGKRYVSPHMTKSEFVQLVFGTILALEEHECRENFYYKGRRVYGPHIDVDALWSVAAYFDAR